MLWSVWRLLRKSFHDLLVYLHFVNYAHFKACFVLYGDVLDGFQSHASHLYYIFFFFYKIVYLVLVTYSMLHLQMLYFPPSYHSAAIATYFIAYQQMTSEQISAGLYLRNDPLASLRSLSHHLNVCIQKFCIYYLPLLLTNLSYEHLHAGLRKSHCFTLFN